MSCFPCVAELPVTVFCIRRSSPWSRPGTGWKLGFGATCSEGPSGPLPKPTFSIGGILPGESAVRQYIIQTDGAGRSRGWSSGLRAASHERRATSSESRPLAAPTARGGQVRRLNGQPLRPTDSDRLPRGSLGFCLSIRNPHSAIRNALPRPPSPSHFFCRFSPDWHGSYPQALMPIITCQIPSNSSQNRSKRRRFPSKRHQKRAQIVMPILTFWGWTPSGASAKADFALRKGKKARFGGAKRRPEKLSTRPGFGIRDSGFGKGQRPGVRDCRRRETHGRSGRRPRPAGCTLPRPRR